MSNTRFGLLGPSALLSDFSTRDLNPINYEGHKLIAFVNINYYAKKLHAHLNSQQVSIHQVQDFINNIKVNYDGSKPGRSVDLIAYNIDTNENIKNDADFISKVKKIIEVRKEIVSTNKEIGHINALHILRALDHHLINLSDQYQPKMNVPFKR